MNETPWSSWDEWRLVYSLLYSKNNPDLQRDGCRRIHAWILRSGGKMALPVKATYDIVEAQLLDNSAACSSEQVRLSYSMALVRLVNNAADDGQRGEYAQSVAALASKIGLPKWLVDVRHESTHQSLASVQVLRLASVQALVWLEEHYWKAQAAEIVKIQPSQLDERVSQLAECLNRGALLRDVGPKLPMSSTPPTKKSSAEEEGDEEDAIKEQQDTTTAQDIVDILKDTAPERLARALFRRFIGSEPDEDFLLDSGTNWLAKWERVLHWLDGDIVTLRICRGLLVVALREALKSEDDDPRSEKMFALIRGLLSRRYHVEAKAMLGKYHSKVLSIDQAEHWSKGERQFMMSFAPCDKAASAGLLACRSIVSRCLRKAVTLPTPSSDALVRRVLLPCLAASSAAPASSSSSSSRNHVPADEIEELLELRREIFQLRNGLSEQVSVVGSAPRHQQTKSSTTTLLACSKLEETLKQFEKKKEEDLMSQILTWDDIQPNGSQQWTRVKWPGGPAGCVLGAPFLQCPALSMVPSPLMQLHEHKDDHDESPTQQVHQELQTTSGSMPAFDGVQEMAKRIRLLIE